MDYKFLDSFNDIEDINLPESGNINKFLIKNNSSEIYKAIEFFKTEEKLLYIHGFLGTGKRQFINYVCDFLNKDVIKLEYYCKSSTVCDDILLSFIDTIESNPLSKAVNINAKITTLTVKFQQYISSIKKPVVIILHALDDVSSENLELIISFLEKAIENSNIKIIASTRAMTPDIFANIKIGKKIFLKALTKDLFQEYILSNDLTLTETVLEDFYKYTRGYYYYTALTLKIIKAMESTPADFLNKFAMSGMDFDSYLGITYINMIPNAIRNFFWFLRSLRHGITLNALAVFELYDEFAVEYLKANLMIFQVDETIYVQDYFQQNIDISIPPKTEIKLHKYIVKIYEKQLKEPVKTREIKISRQALRQEIEYHNMKISEIENGKQIETAETHVIQKEEEKPVEKKSSTLEEKFKSAQKLAEENKNTEAIEAYISIMNLEDIDTRSLIEARINIAALYKKIGDYQNAQHYYEIVEAFYKKNNEVINLNYLYYELTDVYYLMYKNERAIDTIKKVIYSVDTPQSLMVSSCTLLGNIFTSINNNEEAYSYFQKALDSMDENTPDEILAELFFKIALINDDKGNEKDAFEYYSRCLAIEKNNPYKVLAYSNLGSLYLDNENYSDAKSCFLRAYDMEKANNNYEGVYYTASHLAKICIKERDKAALDYLLEAQQSAEFINEGFYILDSTIALGDYYYNNISLNKKALIQYFKALQVGDSLGDSANSEKIINRINDMKLRMDEDVFNEIANQYG